MKRKLLRAAVPIATLVAAVGSGRNASAAGFEKAVNWSGRYGGMAGAAASHVEGAESLYFNPAGLSSGYRLGLELSGQFSPTFGRFSGPITQPNVRVDGNRTFSPVFAGLVGYRPTERLGLGVGFFVSGGTNADFQDVDLSGFGPGFATFRPELKAYLEVLEASIGASYELFDGFRIGGAWRITIVRADIDSIAPIPSPVGGAPVGAIGVQLKDLTDARVNGFRFGFQYAPKKKAWGLGVNVRTGVSFTADGDLNSQVFVAGSAAPTDLPQSTATAQSVFPWQFSLGAFIAPLDRKLLISAQYDFTNYAAVRNINLTGTIPIPPPPAGTGPVPLPSITTRWMGQNVARIGGEYNGVGNWAFRAGYAYTSHVVPSGFARPTFAAPGSGHTFTGGLGYRFMEGRLRTDLAGEYSWDSGDGQNEFGIPGSFRADAWVIHGGVTLWL